ncbi:basement membrane-specific heparan sulfate proteoglycan core protein isoform X2 [Dromaius novaehollandiae]|uniref:basement membrane-specific heparan sulfate proteoglycan core protein isoform X2 n=1 Tax=Dromaius novaehollandiae TaxID=8790 RepID=UPI00311FDFF0
MGPRVPVALGGLLLLAALLALGRGAAGRRETSFPEDTEADRVGGRRGRRYYAQLSDDEDLLAEEASGDGSGEDGSGTGSLDGAETPTLAVPGLGLAPTVYFRALVNFTRSIDYGPRLEDAASEEFREVAEAVVDTLESEYYKIPGEQVVSVVFIKEVAGAVFVELDVGSEGNGDEGQIREVLRAVVAGGSIASYVTSEEGFQFRRLGTVTPRWRACSALEFACGSGECVEAAYRCDRRPDCRDASDEQGCGPPDAAAPATAPPATTATAPPATTSTARPATSTARPATSAAPRPPATGRPAGTVPVPASRCRPGEVACADRQCVPRDYLCDGERDCADGSDELGCGTPTPCEPNEFKCRNGHCALKLWRCDGDNDCGDGSDESDCPTKAPGDTCGPDQFTCVASRSCIPASYQCDEEPDCPDRSDEVGCVPPQVVTPPAEAVQAVPGQTVRFTCAATGVPTPIITWRLNWGHIPASRRVSIVSEKGQGTLTIRDVKEADQGAYTCEAINARGMVFGIPDGVLTVTPARGPCPAGHFHLPSAARCLPCFCFGVTAACRGAARHRHRLHLRFDRPGDFKGVTVTGPAGGPAPAAPQLRVEPDAEEFQLLDLSRRFLARDAFWALPEPFLGDKTDAYGGALSYAVRYRLGRGPPEPARRPDVVLLGAGRKLLARPRHEPARPGVLNQRRVAFTEDEWEDETGAAVSREQLLLVLQELRAVLVQAVYDGRQTSAGLSAVAMDVSGAEPAGLGPAEAVEECRCPAGYAGLSCQRCAAGFERVPHGPYLGSCSGCSCHGHASACDPVFGHCLSCQHNTEGPRCEKCRAGFFGDATQGTAGACRPCPCPYAEPARRFSESCFLDTDGQATCDACAPGYAGRRCERCAPGFEGDPIQPGGKCTPIGQEIVKCDERGGQDAAGGTCRCKPNVTGRLCDECAAGAFHLSHANPDGCLKCFCMGVSRQCASSSWHRDQVRAAPGTPFSLTDLANARTVSDGVRFAGPHDVVFSAFHALPRDVYFWVLPPRFTGDKVTSYGGELRYTVSQEAPAGARPLPRHPDVLLRGNGIALEHFGAAAPAPGAPAAVVVPFREHAWRRADGREATREHLLMALADVDLLMIRASYWEEPSESRLADLRMDVAVPHATGLRRALEVEDCACPDGYRGPSCQDCAAGFTRAAGGLYLGTCERCRCHGHADECHPDTGVCQDCRDHTEGAQCDKCQAGYYGDATRGTPADCQPCPCHGPPSAAQETRTCFADADGQPTCSACAPGYAGRLCERCSPGFAGDPLQDRPCREPAEPCQCDPRGSLGAECDAAGLCRCKANAEGPRCSSCRPGHFHLSAEHRDGCLPCFCMGVAQQCAAAAASRAPVSTPFAPGAFQGFALVNRQRSARVATGFGVETGAEGPRLTYGRFGQLGRKSYYWQLPQLYLGDKVGSYGGRLRYTLAYTPGGRGAPLPDADVQITGNDITLVAYQPELPPRAPRAFEVVFREQHWQRPDGQPATREHLMMALADLDEILIRATYSTNTASSSIAGVSMETAVPAAPGLPPAPEVEECRCPPGYRGLSCQDCAPGYTRTGGGLYLGHCELCECNGHSDACHPETGACSGCLHHTAGDSCERCSPGFYGDATAGTPEDCQPCACPLLHPENQFSRTCESLGAGGYRCTACEPGYAGQYCEQCAPGYAGDPNVRGQRCLPVERSPLAVRVHPPRTTAAQGSPVTLHCQASGDPPFYYYWSREDGRPLPGGAQSRREGEELHFASIQPSEAGVYVCSCRNLRHSNASRAEVIVTEAPSKPITVTVEEKRVQRVKPGADVTFICTAKSKSPAYTLVWTRQNHGKLPSRAMDFNGILTIRNVQPEDAGVYVCTGSNMLDMDEGTATLYVQAPSKTQMFYGPVEFMEGHRPSSPAAAPSATVEPAQLSVAPGQPAEFRCVATGSPAPAVEWLGGAGGALPPGAVVRGGILRFPAAEPADEAHYLCRARNSAGQHTARAVLRVRGAGAPQVQVSPERAEVHEGSTVRLYCRVSGSPDATVAWEKQGGALPPQSRSEHTDIATLVIPSIAAAHGGVYLCVGTSAAGTARAKIDVVVVPGAAPPVRVESPSPSVAEGQTLDLDCVVAGQGQATVTWYKRGGSLPAGHQVSGTRLRIPRVTAADSGEYVCRVASAADAVQEASFFVTVYAPGAAYPAGGAAPVRIESPSSPVLEGQTLELNCDIGEGQTSVMWYKRSGSLPAHHQVSGSRLRIPHVTAADAGEYVCRVSTGAAVREASIVVTVKAGSGSPHGPAAPGVAPPIRIEASSSAVAEGQSLELNCVVASPAQATVTWYKRGGSLPAKHQVSGSRLRLLQVTAADSGEYVCRVSTEAATKEASVMVTIQPSGAISYPAGVAPPVRIESSSSSVAEGQTLDLNCVVAGPGQATVTWYKRGGSLPAKHQVSGSRLRLLQVTAADSGEYVCRVSTGVATKEASVMVTIQPSGAVTHPAGVAPPVRIESSSPAVAEGQSLELNCVIASPAQATVTWYKRGGSLPAKHQVSGSRLRLLQVTAADSGEYVCRVSTEAATKEASVMVTIQPSGAISYPAGVTPPVRIESSSSSVAEGQTLDLNCIVAGRGQATVTWYKRGGSLPAKHQVSGTRLRIPQVSAADSGEYVCRVTAAGVTQESSLLVTIQSGAGSSYAVGVTPPVRIETSSASVAEGQTLELNCMVAGQGHPHVTWYRRGAALSPNSQVSGSRLRLVQVSVADSGEYVCRVSSGTATQEASVVVTVPGSAGTYYSPGAPQPVRIESSSSSIAEGQTLDLNCVVAGPGQATVTWYKRGGPLPAGHQVSGTRLRIPQVSAADSGEYVCRVTAAGVTQESSLVVTIDDGAAYPSSVAPPVRIESSASSVTEGQTLDLNCVVAGQGQATVTWYKRGGSLPAKHQLSGSRLRLSQLSVADSGEYVCRVGSGSSTREATIAVTVSSRDGSSYRLQSPIISIDPHSMAVAQGEDATFKCRIHDGARPINVTWRMGPGQHLQDNVKISPNGSVISIAGAHAGNQGAYHCVASNRFGIASSVVNLLVQGAPTVSVMPPGPVTVKEGKSISLECLGRGEPRPLVRWSRAGSRQKVEHQTLLHMDSQAVLQLAPAKAEHAGTYVCTAHNALGSAQAQVAVSVETAQRTPGAPEVVVSPAVTVVAGDTATLSCSATGEPAPTVEWSKLRAPLPWQHRVLNGTLVIPRAAQQDSGQYICNASNAAGFAEAFVTLDVETPPYATVLPEESAARAGETLQLQCLAHGTPPLRYHWAKVNGSLPARAARRDGLLRLGPALPDDAGTYRCLVSNRVGAAEAFARVAVHGEHPGDGAGPVPAGPPTVRVTPQSLVRGVGGTAEFACAVDGDPRARVEWLKDGGELPPGSSVRDGVLRISDLDRKSQGTYTCRASSPGGQAEGSATLAIQALPRALINIRTAVQTVLAGTAVELECLGLGEPKPHVTWSKVGGRIRPGVLVSAGTLRIERVERSDAGQYRCTAANAVGAVQSHVILHVQAAPQIAGQPEVKEVSVGSAAVFPCLASGFPVPEVKWSKLEGELPEAARVEGTVLTLPAVRPEDAGVYVCAASNRQGQETAFSVLRVRERLVPYFTQTPRSFLPLPTIKDAYKKFEIQITFRPDVADGMLLYNGQRKSSGADFVSFGLVGGRPEFRFDAGSGMATIRHPTPLRLGEYHTVRLFRNLTQGSLALDGFPPVNGTSQGKFQGLDLNEELYLGGYPDYGAVAKTGLRGGFVGCVRQLLIQGEEVVFGEPQLRAHGVADCPTCRDRPCQNGGVCEDTESSAYVCRCPPGFTGSNCEYSQALHCHPEACGPDATCVNRPDGQGYTCRCHLGKSGEKCMDGEAVSAPSFDGEGAFISYPPLTNIHHELRVDAEFKPLAPDGLLLFSGGKAAPVEDFVALAMADGHLEFRYELGSGPAVLRSPEPLALGRWHRVSAERLHKDGTLVVDGGPPVKRSSPGKSQGLNLRTPLYLGGVEPSLRLPGPANVSAAFRGCIGEVSVNGKKVDVSYSFLQSRGVAQCRESSPCERAPCRHGGRCVPAAAGAFRCLCRDGFSGPRCELADDRCLLGNPCLHGGTCKANACLCAEGFAGAFCQHGPALAELDSDWAPEGSGGNGRAAGPRRAPGVPAPRLSRLPSADAPGQFGASFRDGGYLALPGHLFARGAPGAPETVALEVRTGSADGVLLWHGAEPGDGGKAKDFIGLGLRDGHLVFSYQLGSGEATIVSEDPVNDGEWHRVTATREGRRGWLQVDGEEPVYGESPGTNIMANTEGNIYLGGAPDPRSLTAGKFVSGITGCLRGLVLAPLGTPAHPIDLRHRAAGGTAVPECPS